MLDTSESETSPGRAADKKCSQIGGRGSQTATLEGWDPPKPFKTEAPDTGQRAVGFDYLPAGFGACFE